MSPAPATTRTRDERGYEWLTLSDFTAGIQQPMNLAPGTGAQPQIAGLVMTDPNKPTAALYGLGQSQPSYSALTTVSCIGLTSGGLSGLPSRQGYGSLANYNTAPTAGTNAFLGPGLVNIEPALNFNQIGQTFSWVAYTITYQTPAGMRTDLSYYVGTAWHNITSRTMAGNGNWQPPTYLGIYYILTGGQLYPEIFWTIPDSAGQVIYISPVPSAGVGSALSTNAPGWFFSHQGRLVQIAPIGNTFAGGTTTSAYGFICFTDPPQSLTLGTQNQLFFTTYLDAIGTWGSLSSGELLLVTANNGGVVISGDVFSPYVTTVPSVAGTGSLIGKASVSPIGLVYCSQAGVWNWNGGQQAQFLSQNMNPRFWTWNTFSDGNTFNCQAWGNWIVIQGNFLYDTINGGWWVMDDPFRNTPYIYYNAYYCTGNAPGVTIGQPSPVGQALFAAPGSTPVATPNAKSLVYYTMAQCASTWSYLTNMFKVADGEEVDVREIIFTAMNFGTYTYYINPMITTQSGLVQTGMTMLVIPPHTNKLTQYRMPVYIQTDMIQVGCQVTSTDPNNTDGGNFLIASIAVGYETRWKVPAH